MELNPSTYYYRPKVSRALRDQAEAELLDKIEHLQSGYSCYGHRTLKAQLMRHYGLVVNKKRLLRVMRGHNLFRQIKKRFIATTDSNHEYPVYPNLLQGLEVTGINQVWVSDITYIRILTGFVYLAVVLDIFSRRVVGWAISKNIRHELTVAALQMAIQTRKPTPGTIHHSDRGVQYACEDYVAVLKEHQFQISMSAVGNPYDNACGILYENIEKRGSASLRVREFHGCGGANPAVHRGGLQPEKGSLRYSVLATGRV